MRAPCPVAYIMPGQGAPPSFPGLNSSGKAADGWNPFLRLVIMRGRDRMRFGFSLSDETGMAPQADVMFEVEVVFRARSQAVRTILSAPPSVDQMPRERECGEQYRVQIEPVIIRIAPVHIIIVFARP